MAYRLACRGWSWFDRTSAGQRSGPNSLLAPIDDPGQRAGLPGLLEQLELEHEVARLGVGGGGFQGVVEQLADRHPTRDLVDDRPELGEEVLEIRVIPVVEVLLAVPRPQPGRAPRAGRCGAGSRAGPGA